MAANAEVHAVLTTCGVANQNDRNLIINNEAFNTLEDIAIMSSDSDVTEMAKRMAQRTQAEGRLYL